MMCYLIFSLFRLFTINFNYKNICTCPYVLYSVFYTFIKENVASIFYFYFLNEKLCLILFAKKIFEKL